MRIVSWNCNTAFCGKNKNIENRKFQILMEEYPADIYVIQECENPSIIETEEYKALLSNGFWVGKETEKAQEKGMAIFSPNKEIKLEKEEWAGLDQYKFFLPVRVNDKFTLVGVWTHPRYCIQCHNFISANEENLSDDVIMIGDFNSNITQDYNKPKSKTWGKCVEFYNDHGLVDAYHYLSKEEQGKESIPTYFQSRNLNNSYHFDHCIVSPRVLKDFRIETDLKWAELSDHMPIILDI